MNYAQLLDKALRAIERGESDLIIWGEHKQPDIYFGLPSPQRAGTITSNRNYNLAQARTFLKNHGYPNPYMHQFHEGY